MLTEKRKNPILSYREDSYEELHFSDDFSVSSLETLLMTFIEFLEGDD